MSDRRPTDDELLLEALEAARAGNGAAAAAEARLAHDRALQAELEGLKAVQKLLAEDAAWGQQSGADAPPPHLLDAILRAEVAARPAAVRDAVVSASAPTPPAPAGLWSRFSSWLVGGGVVVGAAAALLLTVSREPAELLVPAAAGPAGQAMAPSATVAPPPPAADAVEAGNDQPPADKAPAPAQEAAVDAPKDAVTAAKRLASEDAGAGRKALAVARPTEGGERDAFVDGSLGGSVGDLGVATGATRQGLAKGNLAGPDSVGGGGFAREEKAAVDRLLDSDNDDEAPAAPPPPAEPAPEPVALATAPAPATTSSAPAAAPPPAKPAPRVVSAREAQAEFLRARAKAEAIADAKEQSKAKATESKVAKKSASEARREADTAREELARSQRLQEANGVLVAAERELQFARFAGALDLAQRAEALAGGGLGLAPASTQARAFVGLKRFADAARVASRLLQASPADPQLVDGMIAGADAAVAIGDLRLAERLLQRAASTDNPDAGRRAIAQQKLAALSGKASAPAKAKAKADSSSTTSSDQ